MQIDAILIDDDPWVQSEWRDQGKKSGKSILVFGSFEKIMPHLESFRRDIPIFIDVELGEHMNGIDVARLLDSFGMTQLFLATAHGTLETGELSFLKGVVGKEPPVWLIPREKPSRKLSAAERLELLQRMSPDQKERFNQRILEYENALYGLDGILWLDGIGTHYPDDVLDAWERGIYEGRSESELMQLIQVAWRESLGG